MSGPREPDVNGNGSSGADVRLRLYVAGSAPTSVRAQQNLSAALDELGGPRRFDLEILNVSAHPRRAIVDGVIVTPTLIGSGPTGKVLMLGDLTDASQLKAILADLAGPDPALKP